MKITKFAKQKYVSISNLEKLHNPYWNGGWSITIKVFGGIENTSHKYLILALYKALINKIKDFKFRWKLHLKQKTINNSKQ